MRKLALIPLIIALFLYGCEVTPLTPPPPPPPPPACAPTQILCSGVCVTAACNGDADCPSGPLCTTAVCDFPGTCMASCSYQSVACGTPDGCCPAGCSPLVLSETDDCCTSTCTGKLDNICYSQCNSVAGCSGFRQACAMREYNAKVCSDSLGGTAGPLNYYVTCCSGAVTSCPGCFQTSPTNVSCGGPCSCPDGQPCSSCYAGNRPWYCDANGNKIMNCTQCGCPPPLQPTWTRCCPDGGCTAMAFCPM